MHHYYLFIEFYCSLICLLLSRIKRVAVRRLTEKEEDETLLEIEDEAAEVRLVLTEQPPKYDPRFNFVVL